MRVHALSLGIALMPLLISAPAAAQSDGADDAATTDTGSDVAEIGGGRWSASLLGAGAYTDNFFYESDRGRKTGGWLLRPEAGFLKETSRAHVDLRARSEYAQFNIPGASDDYLDYGLGADGFLQASTRNRFTVDTDFRHGHDPFGLDRTEGATPGSASELDEWDEASGMLKHHFGVPAAVFNTELGLGGRWRKYTTNRSSTQFLDYTAPTAGATFFYNYSAKTSALIDASRTEYDFGYSFAGTDNRSGTLDRYRLGVKWIATGKTTGDLRVGYRHREFDGSDRVFDGLDWDAGITWRPVGQTVIRLDSGRSEQASYLGSVSTIDARNTTLSWTQPWTARFESDVRWVFTRAEFIGISRRDDFTQVQLEMRYRLDTRVSLVGNAVVANRDSTAASRDFDRFSTFAGVQVRL